jgi:hypothetical protein
MDAVLVPESGSQESDGFTMFEFKRVTNFKNENNTFGFMEDILESPGDVVTFKIKEPEKVEENKLEMELKFEYEGSSDISNELKNSGFEEIPSEAELERGIFFGFDGLRMMNKKSKKETHQELVLANIDENPLNRIKLTGNKDALLSPLDKKLKMTGQWVLLDLLSYDFSSKIKQGKIWDSATLKNIQKSITKYSGQEEFELNWELVLKTVELIIRDFNPSIFHNEEMQEVEAQMKELDQEVITMQNLEDLEVPFEGEIEEDKVYKIKLNVKYNLGLLEEEFDDLEEIKQLVVNFNYITVYVQKVPYTKDYLNSFAAGFGVKIQAMFDEKKLKKEVSKSDQFFQFSKTSKKKVNKSSHSLSSNSDNSLSMSSNNSEESEKNSKAKATKKNKKIPDKKDEDEEDVGGPTFTELSEHTKEKNYPIHYSSFQISALLLKHILREMREFLVRNMTEEERFDMYIRSTTHNKWLMEEVPETLDEIQKIISSTLVHAAKLPKALINKTTFKNVDQVVYGVKKNEGMMYLFFRFAKTETWDSDQQAFNWEFFAHLVKGGKGFSPPDLSSGGYPEFYPLSLELLTFLESRKVMYTLAEEMDNYGMKMNVEQKSMVVSDQYDEETDYLEFYDSNPDRFQRNKNSHPKVFFQSGEEIKKGLPRFVDDYEKREFQVNLITYPLKYTMKDPTYRQVPHKDTQKAFPEKIPAHVDKRHDDDILDFAGEEFYNIRGQYVKMNVSQNPRKREFELQSFDLLTMTFTLTRSKCPVLYEQSFTFTPNTTCRKVYKDHRYMLEFKDTNTSEFTKEVPVERVIRIYTFLPDTDTPTDSENLKKKFDLHVNTKLGEEYADITSYQSHLVYKFFIVSSMDLESKRFKNKLELTPEQLKSEGVKIFQKVKTKSNFKQWTASNEMVAQMLKGIATKENDFAVTNEKFLKLFKSPQSKNKSEFGKMEDKLEVVAYLQDGVPSLEYNVQPDHPITFGVRFFTTMGKDLSGDEKELKAMASAEDSKQGFLQGNAEFALKKNFFELVEKYHVEVRDYEYFDMVNARYEVGYEVNVQLMEQPDPNYFDTKRRALLVV